MKNKISNKISKYLDDYTRKTKSINATRLENASKLLILECELEILRLIKANNIKLKTIKRLKKCICTKEKSSK